ncbi:MAG TPA: LiaF domain-containing protein [Gemmatimonadales bacterium]|nr:LiaF domain-containing protein [Gemmatimonadales bacterium]
MNRNDLPLKRDDLDRARDDAAALLYAAAEERRISDEVLELRLALIGEAPSPAAVAAIVADLAPQEGESPAVEDAGPGWIAPAELTRVSAVFGNARREGRWTAPLALEIRCIFGEVVVDLRDAMFGADVLDIDVVNYFGKVVVTLPSGTEVENDTSTVFGSAKHVRKSRDAASPNGLLVRVNGNVVFGELVTRERHPTDLAPPPRPGLRGWLDRVRDRD